jgi:hypothetical protein
VSNLLTKKSAQTNLLSKNNLFNEACVDRNENYLSEILFIQSIVVRAFVAGAKPFRHCAPENGVEINLKLHYQRVLSQISLM